MAFGKHLAEAPPPLLIPQAVVLLNSRQILRSPWEKDVASMKLYGIKSVLMSLGRTPIYHFTSLKRPSVPLSGFFTYGPSVTQPAAMCRGSTILQHPFGRSFSAHIL